MRFMSIYFYLCIVVVGCFGKPFLYNSGKTILQSLFSSKTDNSSSNIEDLRLNHRMQQIQSMEIDNVNIDESEPSPGIIHKKIAKLLRKLQLFSALRHRFTQMEDESSAEIESTTELLIDDNNNETVMLDRIYVHGAPNDKLQTEQDDGKLSLQSGSLGVYVMELFGTLATLIYGAAVTVANAVNGTQTANNV